MRKIVFLLFVVFIFGSCDLLFNRDSDSTPPSNDIAISSIDASSPVAQGDSVNIDVMIKNTGSRDVKEDILITLSDLTEDTLIGTQTLEGGLAQSDSATISYSWDTGNSSIGEHNLIARHNISDDNVENDSLMSTLSINQPDITDIAVSEITAPTMVTKGDVVDIEVSVENVGSLDVGDAIDVVLTDETSGTTIGTQTISNGITEGESATLTYSWDTGGGSIGDHELTASLDFDDENAANDSRSQTVTISEAPVADIAVVEMETPDSATMGDEVDVSITVQNVGGSDASQDFTVTLTDQTDDNEIASQTVSGGLDSGSKAVLSFTWNTSEASVGDHTLVASHNFDDENNENDSRTQSVTVTEAPVADIAITALEGDPTSVTQGEEVNVSITVQNVGNLDTSENFEVTLMDQTDNEELTKRTIEGGLAEGNQIVISFNWDTDQASVGNHTLVASHNFDDENSNNDSSTSQVTIKVAPVTDIAITEFDVPSSANQGDKVDVSVTVANQGNQNLDQPLEVTLRDQTDGTTIDTKTVNSNDLQPSNSTTLNFTWDTKDASIGDHDLVVSHDLDDDNEENDSRSATITINEPPFIDLAIESVNGPSSARQGDNVQVSVELRNLGNRNINRNFKVTLTDEKDGTTIETQTVSGGLDEGATTTVNFTWNTDEASLGNHTLTASHNLNDDQNNNNSGSTQVSIFLLDLAITDVKADDEIDRGDVLNVDVTLRNVGNRDVDDSITITLFNQRTNSTIGTQIIFGLESGESAKFTFRWFTNFFTPPGNHTLEVSHDFEDHVNSNNSRTINVDVDNGGDDDDDDE